MKIDPTNANKAQLAAAFDVSLTTIDKWIGQGCPFAKSDKRGIYSFRLARVHEWKMEREIARALEEQAPSAPSPLDAFQGALDLDAERARLAKAQADKIEMDLAERRGQLLEIAVIETAWTAVVMRIRAVLLPLGSRIAPELFDEPIAQRKAKDRVDKEVHQALTDLSESTPPLLI